MKKTQVTKQSDIIRGWHVIDANDQILGRISTGIAQLLTGKAKPYFVRNIDCGDHVIVINAAKVQTTGNKLHDKIYTHYSGYPGGKTDMALEDLLDSNPTQVIRNAVWGMLPNNKLRSKMMTRLHIYKDDVHPYKQNIAK